MMLHPGQALDHLRDPGQRPQLCAEPVGPRARSQGPLDPRQVLWGKPRLAARPARRLQAGPPLRLPGLMPVIGGGRRHAHDPRHHRLRLAPREQLRGLKPPSFQRSKIPSGSAAGRWHGSACDGTRENR